MAPILAALAVAVSGCDSNSSTPTAPSGTLQVTTARATLAAGETAVLSVTGSGGAPVTGLTWSTTDASVLTVSAAGTATAARAGRVTVTATAGSASGSLALRVVPDYAGTWTGGLARLQVVCSPASASPLCAPGAGTAGTVTLRVTQIGDQLTATLTDSAEPAAIVPLTGTVLGDDQLFLAGRLDVPATTPTTRVEVASLRATRDVTVGTLSGSYQWLVDRVPATGGALQTDYRAQAQFRDLRR